MTKSLFSVLVWASIGGGVILVGLLLEKLWDKGWYPSVSHLRRSRIVKEIGAWSVIVGIVIEIIVAIVFAKDAWENDPRDQPVKTIRAEARLVIPTEDAPKLLLYPAQNWWLQCDGELGKEQIAMYLLTGTSSVISPIQSAPITNALCLLEFKSITSSSDSWVFQFQAPKNQPRGPAKEVMKRIHRLDLVAVAGIPTYVIRGRVALIFNDSVVKYFDVAPGTLTATNNTSNEMP